MNRGPRIGSAARSGIAGQLAGVGAILVAPKSTTSKAPRLAIATVIDLLSILHIVRGFGIL